MELSPKRPSPLWVLGAYNSILVVYVDPFGYIFCVGMETLGALFTCCTEVPGSCITRIPPELCQGSRYVSKGKGSQVAKNPASASSPAPPSLPRHRQNQKHHALASATTETEVDLLTWSRQVTSRYAGHDIMLHNMRKLSTTGGESSNEA